MVIHQQMSSPIVVSVGIIFPKKITLKKIKRYSHQKDFGMKSLGVSHKSKAIKCVGSVKVDPFSIGILWKFPTLGRHYIKCDQRSWLEISACSLWFLHLHSEPCAIRERPIKWDPNCAMSKKLHKLHLQRQSVCWVPHQPSGFHSSLPFHLWRSRGGLLHPKYPKVSRNDKKKHVFILIGPLIQEFWQAKKYGGTWFGTRCHKSVSFVCKQRGLPLWTFGQSRKKHMSSTVGGSTGQMVIVVKLRSTDLIMVRTPSKPIGSWR